MQVSEKYKIEDELEALINDIRVADFKAVGSYIKKVKRYINDNAVLENEYNLRKKQLSSLLKDTCFRNKGVLYCFANDRHARAILSDLYKSDGTLYINTDKNTTGAIVSVQNPVMDIYSKEIQEKFLQNMFEWNNSLLQDKKALDFLYKKRGLTKDTVEFCGIGIDKKKRLWTIPTFKYDCKNTYIAGFEYRQADLSKKGLHRTKNTPNSMAMINTLIPEGSSPFSINVSNALSFLFFSKFILF